MEDVFEWTPELTAVLVQFVYRGLDADMIAGILGCTQTDVNERFYSGAERHVADLTKKEVRRLRASFRKCTYDELQQLINSSLASLVLICMYLGLHKKTDGNEWSEHEANFLKRLRAEGRDINECAALLGRTKKSLVHRIYDKKEHFVCVEERGRKLDREELQRFIADYPHKKNADLQRRYGISCTYLHRLAREHGLKKTPRFMKEAQRAAAEAANQSHIANGTYPPKGFRIPGSEKNCFRKGVNNEMRFGKARERQRVKKAAQSLALRRRREKALVFCGLPQKTKLRVVSQGSAKRNYRFGLRKCGYKQDEQDTDLFYYPEDGSRHFVRERNAKKHGVRFRSRNASSKVSVDEIHFVKMEAIFGEPEKKPKKKIPDSVFGIHPVSNRIVNDLGAYACDSSFLYDE